MIETCIDALDGARVAVGDDDYSWFFCHTIKDVLDFENDLSTAWRDFEALTSAEWEHVRSIVDLDLAAVLGVYSIRMSSLAVRRREPTRLHDAAMGLIVDRDLRDYRDICTVAALVYDASTRLGAEPEDVFRGAMRYATTCRRSLLDEYLRGPSYTKSVHSMGFDAVRTHLGFVYRIQPM